MASFQCETDELASIPPGTVSVKVVDGGSYLPAPDYRLLPRSVTELTIDDYKFEWALSPLPGWLVSLTLTEVTDPGSDCQLPPELEKLVLIDCSLDQLGPFPSSLQSLEINGCYELCRIEPLPPVMTLVEIVGNSKLSDFSFLPTERVDRLTLTGVYALESLDKTPAEVGVFTIDSCEKIRSLAGIKQVTGSLRIKDCSIPGDLTSLASPIETLHLIRVILDDAMIPASVKHLVLSYCRLDLAVLPRGLESLSHWPSRLQSLKGIPEDLVRLELAKLRHLVSYAELPLFLRHISIKEVPGPKDFPRLAHLESAEIDYVMTKDRTEYTSGEQYLADSKMKAKSARS